MSTRIIAIGEPEAGDDGVGPAVIAHLLATGGLGAAELVTVGEASALVPLLEFDGVVILVDALLGVAAPGEVFALAPEALDVRALAPLSTHGIGVGQAIALARMLAPERVAATILIVGVAIERPRRLGAELSAPVAAAVAAAAERVRALVARVREVEVEVEMEVEVAPER